MIGVSVLVKGTTTGIITDVEGNFTVPAKTGDVFISKVSWLQRPGNKSNK